jgi:predicted dehydrogenase
MKKYHSAIIGCGPRGRMHVLAYEFVPQAELTACCDLDIQRRNELAAEFGLQAYAGAEEMLEKEKPDLIHLVTAPNTRVPLMTLVDQAGIPACIVEKPVAYQVQDWKALAAFAQQTKTQFAVGAQFRYHPDLTRCRLALQSGSLGILRSLEFSAVGTICDQGVHGLDWAMSLNEDSPPVRIFGTASGAQSLDDPRHPSPETSTAQIVFANGVTGYWTNGYTAQRVLDDPAYYKHGRVAGYATRGHVLFEEFGNWEIVSTSHADSGHADNLGWMHGNHLAQANLTMGMFSWLEGGVPVGTNLNNALTQWNAVLGLYASTVRRMPIDLPFEPSDDLWDEFLAVIKG